jgi:hypothetical protein
MLDSFLPLPLMSMTMNCRIWKPFISLWNYWTVTSPMSVNSILSLISTRYTPYSMNSCWQEKLKKPPNEKFSIESKTWKRWNRNRRKSSLSVWVGELAVELATTVFGTKSNPCTVVGWGFGWQWLLPGLPLDQYIHYRRHIGPTKIDMFVLPFTVVLEAW